MTINKTKALEFLTALVRLLAEIIHLAG